ncbi:putative polygalacturonase [Camellia lanceoleosa]|uniref:Polygalacturonase n=1 Tax=Camellia lanceoleosa TaxID=1840588 RepID=A0ACC0FC97_9ERIC|nr:putative polygalacturonase [Camellia lanceoleosa]
MGKLSSSSASNSSSSSSSSTFSIICCIYYMYLFSNFTNVEGFDSLIQLPHSGGSRHRPRSKKVLYVTDYGAKGHNFNDDTEALKDVWKVACSLSSRPKIVIPVGHTYLVRPIDFAGPCRSKITLRISGTIVAPKDPDVWDGLNPRKWLYFHGVNHLTVEGGGIIDGMGQEWWSRSCKINKTNPCRHAPTALTFHRCKNLRIRNLMMVNSQQMHLAFTSCVRVAASRLKVLAPGSSPNTDGIHISASTLVEVKESIVRTGDDCISIVGNSSSIRIRNISCGPGHGISIGSLGKSSSLVEVHNVSVDGAFLSNTENGVRIKTWQGGSGFATKIAFQNVWMENVSNPIIIDQFYCDSPIPCENQTLAVKVEDISFMAIKGTSATEEAIKFACSDTFPCESLYLEDIQLDSYSGGSTSSFCWEAQGSCSGLDDGIPLNW